MTILYFALAIGILVAVHEFGHFYFAKRAKIFVDEFSIGFGPKLFGFKRGETEYRFCLLPFGGYVKMLGQEPSPEVVGNPRAFCNRSLWERFLVVVWGPLMNLLLCAILLPIVFMLGRQIPAFFDEAAIVEAVRSDSPAVAAGFLPNDRITSVNQFAVNNWEDALNQIRMLAGQEAHFQVARENSSVDLTIAQVPKEADLGIEPYLFYHSNPRVLAVSSGSPASQAGLQVDDKLLQLNGEALANENDVIERVNKSGGNAINLTIERAGKQENVNLVPEYNEQLSRWLLGIQLGGDAIPSKMKRYGLIAAIQESGREMAKLSRLLFDVLHKMFTFQLSKDAVGGPILIAKSSAAAASAGLAPFLYFLAFLSLQLCILNLLPIPVLDGGHLLFIFIETLIRRPIPHIIRQGANILGAVFLIGLMLLVTLMDVNREWQVLDKIGSWFGS